MAHKPSRNGSPARKKRLLHLTGEALEGLVWARHDGGKGKGPPTCSNALPADEDDREQRFTIANALRRVLAKYLGTKNLDKALRIVVVECPTCEQLGADLCGITPGNACRWKQRFLAYVRKAILAVAWRPAQRQHGAERRAANLLARLKTTLIAEAVSAEIAAGKMGATVDPTTAEPSLEIDAWCVSLAGTEQTFLEVPTVANIAAYVEEHRALLDNPGHHQGAWFDSDRDVWGLEVTVLVRELAQAQAVGFAQGQRSIYNLKTKQLVALVAPGKEAA